MRTQERLWRTEKGDLVEDGHPEAVLLAYGEDAEVSEEDAKSIRRKSAKQSPAPANKQAAKASDKQAPAPKNK